MRSDLDKCTSVVECLFQFESIVVSYNFDLSISVKLHLTFSFVQFFNSIESIFKTYDSCFFEIVVDYFKKIDVIFSWCEQLFAYIYEQENQNIESTFVDLMIESINWLDESAYFANNFVFLNNRNFW